MAGASPALGPQPPKGTHPWGDPHYSASPVHGWWASDGAGIACAVPLPPPLPFPSFDPCPLPSPPFVQAPPRFYGVTSIWCLGAPVLGQGGGRVPFPIPYGPSLCFGAPGSSLLCARERFHGRAVCCADTFLSNFGGRMGPNPTQEIGPKAVGVG